MKKYLALGAVASSAVAAFAQTEVTRYDFDSNIVGSPARNLSFTQSPLPGAFTSPGDGFERFQRGVSGSIPFGLLDDTCVIFPGDVQGMVDETKLDGWFGVIDLVNDDNPAGTGTATWTFDISGFTDLEISIDMAAMGNYELPDSGGLCGGFPCVLDFYNFTYSIDGGAAMPLFTSTVVDGGSRDYNLACGAGPFTLSDPLDVNGVNMSNLFQTLTAAVAGTGNTLTLTFSAGTDGGEEGFAFDTIVITSNPGGSGCPNPQAGCDNSDLFPSGGDCTVNLGDLGQLLANYQPGVGGKTRDQGDIFPLNGGDGFVDLGDLGQVLSDFNTDCN